MRHLFLPVLALLLVACSDAPEPVRPASAPDAPDSGVGVPADPATATAAPEAAEDPAAQRLQAVLDARDADIKARYPARNPAGTLQFFGIEPGMTVVEALPGGGWYTRILLPYLGPDGLLIGVDYALDMFPLFGFFSEERIEAKKTWREDWLIEAEAWQGEDGARLDAFVFGSMPDALAGTADAVLMIRALHNLNRFEDEGGYRSAALADAFRVLKPGGVLGVVQHEAPPERDRAWADGSRGYLHRDQVIEVIEAAGFEFEQSSDINSNPLDQPGEDDIVWRLPPSLSGSADDPARRSAMEAIGESNRMTLRFRKPD